MVIDAGTRAAHFLPQDRRYSSLASYTVSVSLYQHKVGESEQICMLTSERLQDGGSPLWSKSASKLIVRRVSPKLCSRTLEQYNLDFIRSRLVMYHAACALINNKVLS